MYNYNGIPLQNYGLVHGRAPGSNIALSGFLDMPARLGKTHHDWSDELGTQPYVLASEIYHGGRDITYHGFIKAADRRDAIQKANDLYTDLSKLTDLAPLETSWGTFSVYIREAVRAEYLRDGYARLAITFREPVVTKPVDIPTGSSVALYNMDNVNYRDLGAFVTRIDDNFNRPATKEANFRAYGVEGYQVTRMAPLEITHDLFFKSATYAGLKANVEKFHAMLAAPGTRIMNIDNMERECFSKDGFRVENIRVTSTQAICQLSVRLVMVGAGVPVPPEYLLDHLGEPVLDVIEPIRTPEEDNFLLDERGYNILTDKTEKLTQ